MKTVLAADLGGTKSRFGLVDEALGVHAASEGPTPPDRDGLLQMVDAEFDRLRHELRRLPPGLRPPSALGLGVAGVVDPGGRRLARAANLPLEQFDLVPHLEQRHGLPVTLINDGRASAWGEFARGAARGLDPLLVLFFGTGIGIGLIVDGKPYGGAGNAAGEIGHTVHVPGGRRCSCGRSGCYEAYCGGGPMTRRAAEELGPPPAGSAEWTVDGLCAAAAAQPAARLILESAEQAACALAASLCTLLDPAAVVLGGGVLRAWPALAGRIIAFTQAWCGPAGGANLRFVPSLRGSDAVLQGAARATGEV